MDDRTAANNDYTEEWIDFDDKKNIDGPTVGDVISKNNPHRHMVRNTEERFMAYKYNAAGYVTTRNDYFNAQSEIKVVKYELSPRR
jgi:YD repeat-containing protein